MLLCGLLFTKRGFVRPSGDMFKAAFGMVPESPVQTEGRPKFSSFKCTGGFVRLQLHTHDGVQTFAALMHLLRGSRLQIP